MLGRNTHFTLAIHILTVLALYDMTQRGPAPSSKIAESVNTNPAFLREQIGHLKKAGLVTTRLGAGGGTLLAKEAQAISLLDVYRMTEGETVLQCHRLNNAGNSAASGCPVGANISDFFAGLARDLDEVIAARLQQTSIADIAHEVITSNGQSVDSATGTQVL